MKPELMDAVWEHGRVMPEADSTLWRQDACGAWMRRDCFGRGNSEFGWKIEKVASGQEDSAAVLRPFNVRNSYDIANGRPHCCATADRSSVPAEKYARPPRNRSV